MVALDHPSGAQRATVTARGRAAIICGLLGFSLVASLAPSKGQYSVAAVATWLVAIVSVAAAVWPSVQSCPRAAPAAPWPARLRSLWRERVSLILALLCILALALVLRVVELDSIPPLFHGDEGEMGVDALLIAQGSADAPPLFGTGWFEHPSLHFYLEALSIKLFGVTIFSLRLVTALWGAAGVLATYLAGRELANRRAGVIAAVIAASAPADLQLSRVSLNNVETAVLCALAVGLLARAIRLAMEARAGDASRPIFETSVPLTAVLAGIAAGLSLYFYFASRLIPILLAIILIWAAVRLPAIRSWIASIAAVVLAGFVVTVLPLGIFTLRNATSNGMGRFGTYFILNHLPDAYRDLHVSTPWHVLVVQLAMSLAQFFVRPDGSTFFPFDAPILVAPVAALFGCGLIAASLRWRSLGNATLLAWFWVTLVAGNVLMSYAPYTPRIVGALPAVYVLAASALDGFWRRVEELDSRGLSRVAGGLFGTVLVAITVSSAYNYFFVYFRQSMHPAVTTIARFLAGLPDGTYVYDLPDGLFFGYGSNRYLAYRIAGEDLNDPPRQIPALVPKGRRIAFVVFPKWASELPAITGRFPGGARQDLLGDDGRVIVTTYVVDMSR